MVLGYAVWIACGWSLVAGVSVALISCWQADECAASPHSGTPGRKPVWSVMMPAASSTRLWALTSWHCRLGLVGSTWKCSTRFTGAGPHRGCGGACWRPGTAPRGPHLFEERPNFHISLRTADWQGPARCSIFSYLNFDLLSYHGCKNETDFIKTQMPRMMGSGVSASFCYYSSCLFRPSKALRHLFLLRLTCMFLLQPFGWQSALRCSLSCSRTL